MCKCADIDSEFNFHLHICKLFYLLLNKLDPSNPNTNPMINPRRTFLKKIPMIKARRITKPNEIKPLALSGFCSAITTPFSCSTQ